jgi:uncharacterized membrane protein
VTSRELWLLLAHLAAAAFLTGLIWTIQLVHYPLFAKVGEDLFAAYQRDHSTRITWVVGPAMVVELVIALWLVVATPEAIPRRLAVLALIILCVVHLTTATLSVPAHGQLADGFDAAAHRRLVGTNWIRTIGWSLRTALAMLMLARAVPVRR